MILALRTLATATPAYSVAGIGLEVTAWVAFVAFGAALTVIDVRQRRLPNRLVAGLTASGALFFTAAALVEGRFDALGRATAGLGIALALYLALFVLSRGGLGPGDVKLAAPIGLYLGWIGWEALMWGIVAGFVVGGLAGVAQWLRRRRIRGESVPFGPWMLAGAVIAAVVASIPA